MSRAFARCRGIVVLLAIGLTGLAAPAPAGAAPDSEGTEFWLAFNENVLPPPELTLFITGRTAASGTVEIPGLAVSQGFSVTPGSVASVSLPPAAELTGEGVQAKGIHVTADQEVSVYGLNRKSSTTDAYLGLPVDVLGTEYLVLGYGPGNAGTSELGVAASQDGTTVTITPKVDAQGGHPAGAPYNVALDRGDAYQTKAAISNQDLSGTVITADKPISVYGGHQCANIPNGATAACDHIVEQMPPTSAWGRSFGTVPLKTRVGGDTFQILASTDGTQVQINGATAANLNRGGVHNQLIDGRATITANNPILVAQYSNGQDFDGVTSDPFEVLIPPLEQFLDRYTVTTPAIGFPTNHINLIVPNAAVGAVAIDGTAVPAGQYSAIGSSGFSGAQVDVSVGAHNLTGPGQPFGAFQYGFANADSYGYAGGQSFAPIATVASLSLTPATARHAVGSEGCVTAVPTTSGGAPVPDVRVDFVVTGANPTTGFQNADSGGNAVFCYRGAKTGEDTINAAVGSITATATKTWSSGYYEETCGFEIDGVILEGGDGNDNLKGTDRKDLIKGRDGKDKVKGKQARDCLFGNAGNDKVKGHEADDLIRAGSGRDRVSAGDGDDDVRLQDGDDKGNGGPGNDRIKAQGRGVDKVNCGSGNKDVVIGDRKDTINENCEKVRLVNPN